MDPPHSLVDVAEEQVQDEVQPEKDAKGSSLFAMPSEMSSPVWGALCERMLTDMHRNHMMTADEKETHLRCINLPLPGDPPGREIVVAEDPTGAFAVGVTGAVLWPAAVCLIEKLDRVVPVASKHARSIELGAGLGCVGTFLARYKGHHTVLTDVPSAMPLLQRNVDANFEQDHCPDVLPLCWEDSDHVRLLKAGGSYDLVVGSDVTYRPEYIDDLLRAAHSLLAPGGRVHLALQNRPGEIDCLHSAISRSQLRTISCEEAPSPSCHREMGSTLEEGAMRLYGKATDMLVEVFLLELEANPSERTPAERLMGIQSFVPSTLEEVEDEFFRITGIKPDPSLRPQPQSHEAPCPAQEKEDQYEIVPPQLNSPKNKAGLGKKSLELKKQIIQEYLDRGLDDLLCDMDEDISAAVAALNKQDRPKTAKQKREFVQAFYAASAIAQEPSNAEHFEAQSEEPRLDNVGDRGIIDQPAKAGAEAKRCMEGLIWDVELDYDKGKLIATIEFREELWDMLQGTSSSKISFRDAVNFELSDSDLRVTYMESSVLELRLPQTVSATEAGAKLSSKLRRVTVHAPLC